MQDEQSYLIAAAVSIVIVVVLVALLIASRYRIPDANEALVITGSKGKTPVGEPALKIVIGSGAFIIPFIQRCRVLSLDATEIAMQVPEGVSKDNIKVVVDAVALAKIDGTPEGVRAAAQRFLGREDEIPRIIRSILAGALRGVVGNMTIEEMLRDREGLAAKIQEAASSALSDAGLRVDTLQINGIATDPPDYITNLGRPQAAQVRKTAEVAEAENEQQSARARAEARVKIAAANKEAQLREAEFLKETAEAEAEAVAVGPKTKAAQDALITQAEQANAEQKVALTRLTLDSEVRAKADADLYAAQKRADASLYTAEKDAAARAVVITQQGKADAEASRAKGQAEADVKAAILRQQGLGEAEATEAKGRAEAEAIRAKGLAEAETKEKLAKAYEMYGQQAVIDRVLQALPLMLEAAAKPLGNIDSITVLGDSEGASGVPKLATDTLVKLPAIVKSATGLDITGLFSKWFEEEMNSQPTPPAAPGRIARVATTPAPVVIDEGAK
ncbi:MAG: hypothetical protein LBM94_04310 [Propionibacteriaceae bacterium]|jgi:flotillin|nr:hypothetical protein [Propionibacteriaceae bacterium]